MDECFALLQSSSRSFSYTLDLLNESMRPTVCVFYLVLRILDTIEDDPGLASTDRMFWLARLHSELATGGAIPQNIIDQCTDTRYIPLMRAYRTVQSVLNTCIPADDREIILDVVSRMGHGMRRFLALPWMNQNQYTAYCDCIAGDLSRGMLKLARKYEDWHLPTQPRQLELIALAGRVLQKANIIRDVVEDVCEGRYYWPKELWGACFHTMEQLIDSNDCVDSARVRDAMVMDALQEVCELVDGFDYISTLPSALLKWSKVLMASSVLTLVRCFCNPDVYTGHVKISRADMELIKRVIGTGEERCALKDLFQRYMDELKHKSQTHYGDLSQCIALVNTLAFHVERMAQVY